MEGSFILLVGMTAEEPSFRCCNKSCREMESGAAGSTRGHFCSMAFIIASETFGSSLFL